MKNKSKNKLIKLIGNLFKRYLILMKSIKLLKRIIKYGNIYIVINNIKKNQKKIKKK